MVKYAWQKDWKVFILSVIRDYEAGMSDEQLSVKYGAQEIYWEGIVAEIELDKHYVPGITLDMVKVTKKTTLGIYFEDSVLGLRISEKHNSSWRKVKVGDKVCFKAQTEKPGGVFPAIRISTYTEDNKGIIFFGVQHAKLLKIIK